MSIIKKLYWIISSQFGFDPLKLLRSIRGIPHFLKDSKCFRKDYCGKIVWRPCLHDRYEEGGTTKSEYFWQDLLVARTIFEAKPLKHVDIGSRVDGFVAHVASFREIEVFDVRPVTSSIPGVDFKQADLMNPESMKDYFLKDGYCDSLSCLHALEHFGLGRYGDPINTRGYEKGLANMAGLLKKGGVFYLSVPIGRERVEFNAHWVFAPYTILNFASANDLELKELTVFNTKTGIRAIKPGSAMPHDLAESDYNLGIFVFNKKGTTNDQAFQKSQ